MRLVFFLLPWAVGAVDVVGWLVSRNITTAAKLPWDVYTTVRGASIQVNATGHTSCPNTTYFQRLHALAVQHNTTLTLAPGTNSTRCVHEHTTFCHHYLETIGPTVRSCGSQIQGLSFDYEGHPLEKTAYTAWLDALQRAMGDPYTVGACVGAFGVDGLNHGSSYPLGVLSWVDADMFKANPNLFVNIMGYHAPMNCSLWPWQKDAFVATEVWGLPRAQVNLGLGYFTKVLKDHDPRRVVSEHTWAYYADKCPQVAYDVCVCEGVPFVSKKMNEEIGLFVKMNGFRGVFPWAADYDSFQHNNTLATYIGMGIK